MVGGTRETVSEQLLGYSFRYRPLCECGRPYEECDKDLCWFRAVLYPFIEMRMDEIRLRKHPALIGFTEAEKEKLREQSS